MRRRYHTLRAADIDHHRIGAQQDASDIAVASDALNRLGRYRQRKLEVRSGRTTLPKQCFERGRDLQLWPLPSRLCSRTTIEQVMGGFDQGVAESAIQLAAIVLAGGLRQRFEGSPESCPPLLDRGRRGARPCRPDPCSTSASELRPSPPRRAHNLQSRLRVESGRRSRESAPRCTLAPCPASGSRRTVWPAPRPRRWRSPCAR